MAENNIGGSLRQIVLPYPEFRYGEIIDPIEHNANNNETVVKINEMVTVLNSFINNEANTSLSALAVNMVGVDPITSDNLENWLRTLVNMIRSTTPEESGAHFVQSAQIQGLEGDNVWEQIAKLSGTVTGIDPITGEQMPENGSIVLQLAKVVRDLSNHIASGDHDYRYYQKSQIDHSLKLNEDAKGDFQGKWRGKTLEQVLNASGTEFGLIEVLSEDPPAPRIGRVWILVPEEEEE